MATKKPRRGPGRPANPYKTQACLGEAGFTEGYFDSDVDDLRWATELPPDLSVASIIQGLLLQAGEHGSLALTRTTIEETLNVDHYVPRNEITKALRTLRGRVEKDPNLQVYRTPIEVTGQKTPTAIYSIGRLPTSAELKALQKMMERRASDFDPRLKGKRAEHYVWGLLRRSGRFVLHRKSKCGEIRDSAGKNKLDLLAIEKVTGTRIAISVKCERQWFHARSPVIAEIRDMAKAHDARPMLVAAHLTTEAKARCERNGILVLELARQIVPAELADGRLMRTLVRELRPILGPQKFDYIPVQFPRQGQRSEGVLRDIEFVDSMRL